MNRTRCLQCGEVVKGRSDKKFCDAYCRNTYNNQNKSEQERKIQVINSAIRKNRSILKQLSPVGKNTVRKEVLDNLGYNYNYFSSVFKTSNSATYYLCYDYGFCPIVQNNVERAVIITVQDYMGLDDPWKKT